MVGNAELLCHVPQVFVIGHDAGDVAVELSGLPTSQQVIEAMAHLRHEDCHPGPLVAEIERELHPVTLGVQCLDILLYLLTWDGETFQLPLDTHEEHAFLLVHILVQVNDVSLVVGNELRYFRDDAWLVRTMQQ